MGLAARGMAWRVLLQGNSSYTRVFFVVNIGYLLNNILPLRLGELGRALIMGREGLGFWRVFSTILIERAIDMFLIASMLGGTLPFVFSKYRSHSYVLVVFVIILLGLFFLHVLANRPHLIDRIMEKVKARLPFVYMLIKDRLQSFLLGLNALKKPNDLLKVLGWMTLTWALALWSQYLLLQAFLPQAHLLWIVFGQGVVALGAAAPSSPAYVGIIEAAWVGALSLFGVDSNTALAYAIASHLMNILVTGMIGGYALIGEGESIGELYRRLRNEKSIM